MTQTAVRSGRVKTSHVDLYYEDAGELSAPPVILVLGLGAQLTLWPDALCRALLDSGLRLIRFDSRDIGLSADFVHHLPLDLLANFVRVRLGLPVAAPYDLHDMAADVIAVMDTLQLEQAHLVGASMGGMIAQLVAADYPHRVLSLTSIMSSTNEPHLPMPKLKVLLHISGMTGEKVVDAASAVRNRLALWSMTRSPGHANDEVEVADRAAHNYRRAFRPDGAARHSLAVMATGGFASRLKSITAPTLVIHGNCDPLVPLAGGQDSARAIPGAQLKIIDGMGHDLPDSLCPQFVRLIIENTQRAKNTDA